MDQKHIRTLQREVNVTLDNADVGFLKVPVDGVLGPLTRKHARVAGLRASRDQLGRRRIDGHRPRGHAVHRLGAAVEADVRDVLAKVV